MSELNLKELQDRIEKLESLAGSSIVSVQMNYLDSLAERIENSIESSHVKLKKLADLNAEIIHQQDVIDEVNEKISFVKNKIQILDQQRNVVERSLEDSAFVQKLQNETHHKLRELEDEISMITKADKQISKLEDVMEKLSVRYHDLIKSAEIFAQAEKYMENLLLLDQNINQRIQILNHHERLSTESILKAELLLNSILEKATDFSERQNDFKKSTSELDELEEKLKEIQNRQEVIEGLGKTLLHLQTDSEKLRLKLEEMELNQNENEQIVKKLQKIRLNQDEVGRQFELSRNNLEKMDKAVETLSKLEYLLEESNIKIQNLQTLL
jgi:hypothetical protein